MNDLPDILQNNGITHWKLIVCTPTLQSDSIGKGLVELVKKKLAINPSAMSDQDYDSNVLTCFSAPNVSMCARWIDTEIIEQDIAYNEKKSREYLMGSSAILFLHIEEEESLNDSQMRLKNLIEKIPSVPGVAVVVLTTSTMAKATLADYLGLSTLVQRKLITSFDVFETNVDIFKISTLLSVYNAISVSGKLSKNFNSDAINGMDVKVIRDFVEDFLVDKYFNTVYTDLAERRAKHWPHRTPNDLLNFYNVIIEHLADVSSSKEIENISWPIPELKKMVLDDEIPSYWNDFPYMEQVRSWIMALKLPLMMPKEDLPNYLSQIKSTATDFTLALSRIDYAIKKTGDVPWTDIIHTLIDYKLGHRPTVDPFNTSGCDMVVMYFKHELNNFKFPR